MEINDIYTRDSVQMTPTMTTTPILTAALLGSIATTSVLAGGDTLTISKDGPTLDRWMYPFNGTPGTRAAASTFGIWTGQGPSFDNFDAQFVVGFDTSADLTPGTADDWQITSATVTVQLSNSGTPYDDTVDTYGTFLEPSDPDWIEDVDTGQPIELFGTGFRYDYDATSWPENAPFGFGDPSALGIRSAYAGGFRDGEFVDVSNHVRERWTPTPFAVGIVPDMVSGDLLPQDSVFTFSIDVDDPNVAAYIMSGLDSGMLSFTLASMTIVEFEGDLPFPLFYCKENAAVDFGIASAATLDITLEPASTGNPCDLNGDETVDGADLSILLGSWNTADPAADLDDNGTVDGADLAQLLGCWS